MNYFYFVTNCLDLFPRSARLVLRLPLGKNAYSQIRKTSPERRDDHRAN